MKDVLFRDLLESVQEGAGIMAKSELENLLMVDEAPVNTKVCTKCGVEKIKSDFAKHSLHRDGLSTICRACNNASMKEYGQRNRERKKIYSSAYWNANAERMKEYFHQYYLEHKDQDWERHIENKYGKTKEDYEKMLTDQKGVCAVCGNPETKIDRTGRIIKRLSIDHDHATGETRGLLCNKCNRLIGSAKDNPKLLRTAAEYLEKWGK